MIFYSLRNPEHTVSFRQALLQGIDPKGGLYMPVSLPRISFEPGYQSFNRLCSRLTAQLLQPEVNAKDADTIVEKAFTFSPELKKLDEHLYVLECFHGPTASFKDFGAAFMAQAISAFKPDGETITILVATSGDTGSAVAHAFYRLPGIRVVLLYPAERISDLQEKQLTCLGENITALEVDGNFDDCQDLVKTAFADTALRPLHLTSANSINIGRLLPQSFYYIWSALQVDEPRCFCVPSGNFGNLTAAVMASRMSIPVRKFIAAVNANDTIPLYLNSGKYRPRKSRQTLSNAMDVGNPNNWPRIESLFDQSRSEINKAIQSTSIDDERTLDTIKKMYQRYEYICDPHTAVGMAAAFDYLAATRDNPEMIVVATAHPGKFCSVVEQAIEANCPMPQSLRRLLTIAKRSVKIKNDYEHLKSILLTMNA
ncbi:threonine synthase [candidate division KSB1 bacterium]|nr:threonine synthase [candidate division KSB1 bacterium]